ncbi:FUSC family protein [Aeromicrobium sp. UC242_57]|uniref:FUSC family protein n=1 Tax=Aeromicrobium sp. UC242_57 TaxID=3374624 RepID=UPI003789ADAE
MTLGTAASMSSDPTLWLVVGGSIVAMLTAFAADLLEWKPPGGVFTLFAFAVCTLTPDASWSTVALAAGLSTASAAFAIVVSNIGPRGTATRTRHRTVREHLADRATVRHTSRHFLAPLLTGGIAVALDIGHPYWGMVASVVPLTAPNLLAMAHRGMHRIVGTLAGVAIAGAFLLLDPSPTMLVLAIIVCQVATELIVMRHYAMALVFITPLALLMGQLAHPMPTGEVVAQRAVETILGVAIGLAVALLIRRPPDRDVLGHSNSA